MREAVRRDAYQPPAYLVDQVELTLELDRETTRVHSELRLRRNPASDAPRAPLRLDGEALALHALHLDGTPLPTTAYELDAYGLTIPNAPDDCRVATDVSIHPSANTALMGLYQAGELLCTQCEPEAFRRITYYPDRPDVLAPFRVMLIGDRHAYPVMLSNGNPVAERTTDDGRRAVTWDDPFPKPSYLFAVVAGDISATHQPFTTSEGREVAVNVWTTAAYRHRCEHTLTTLLRAMAWDEAAYDLAYDLDVFNAVAVPQYTQGAMENKGLNIFNERYALSDAGTATDRDHREGESMVAHEFFHNWSGNRVTCRDWFQLGLKEGFTTLREQAFIADRGWAAVRRIEDTRLMRTRQFAEDAGPMAHAVRPDSYREIENFYSDTVYSKGAELFRMIQRLAGDDAFRQGVNRFFARYDGQAVTIEALVGAVADSAGVSFEAFMGWFERAGTPRLNVTTKFNAADGVLELVVRQHPPSGSPDAAPLPMPLAIGLLDQAGNELPVQLAGENATETPAGTRILRLDERDHRFRLTGLKQRPVVALLRDFSAPVLLTSDRTDADYAVLAAHDTDPVARWDATQTLMSRCLAARMAGRPDTANEERLMAVLGDILTVGSGDPGLDALLLALPDEASLLADNPALAIETLTEAREGLRARIASELAGALVSTYEANARSEVPYSPEPEPVGRRCLRDTCLGYLAHPGASAGLERALTQYRHAQNLADAVSALERLAASDHPEREAAIAQFRACHDDNPLVLDKWLAIQARAPRPDTLERVKELLDDPFFSLAEPNRVRALVETFVTENPRCFHRADGAGHRFLGDQVLALDPINPALAAGLLRHLSAWRRHEPARGQSMRAALRRVASTDGLSQATREVVDASLAARSD